MSELHRLLRLSLLLTLFSSSITSSLTNNDLDGASKFVVTLILKKFSNCTVISVEAGNSSSSDNQPDFHQILNNGKEVIGKYLLNLGNPGSNFSGEPLLQMGPSNSRRFSSHCKLAVIFLAHVDDDTQMVSSVRDQIAPLYMPIIRKDEDHFIFVTPQRYHRKLLLMTELPHRTKFKLAVGSSAGPDGGLSVSTISFFGGLNGSPKLQTFLPPHFKDDDDIDYFPDFFWDLNGALIQIVLPETKAFVEPGPSKQVNNGKRGRWLYLFDEYLIRRFNFTYHMFLSTDIDGRPGAGGTGLQLSNGTWIGMTGDLLYGRADLGLAFANTEKRSHFISFTDQIMDIGCLTFVTGQPVEIFTVTAMLDPLHWSTWIGIILSCVTGSVFILLTKAYLERWELASESELRSLSLPSQIRILLAPFIEQDYVEPSPVPLRCFIAFWSFFCIVVTTLYRSKLVTLLAFPPVGFLPETFEELAFSDFQIGFMKHGDSAYNTFKASSEPVYMTLVRNMEVIKGDGLDCLKNVVTHPRYACIAYDFDLVYLHERNLTSRESRNFVIATRGRTYNVWLGLGTEAYSKFRVNFGKVLGWTMPFHLAIIWDKMDMYRNVRLVKQAWWRDSNQTDKLLQSTSSSNEDDDDPKELNLDHVRGIFYVYFGCVLISAGGLIAELIFFKISHNMAKNVRKRLSIS